jgi:hypothetical protein
MIVTAKIDISIVPLYLYIIRASFKTAELPQEEKK